MLTGDEPVLRTVIGAALRLLRRYARYAGRASRMEFWCYMIAANAVQIGLGLVVGPSSSVLSLILFLPSLAVLVRRLHDVDRSGWWALPMPVLSAALFMLYALTSVMLGDAAGRKIFIGIGVTVLGMLAFGITLLIWTCRRGTPGPNRFGPPPEGTPG